VVVKPLRSNPFFMLATVLIIAIYPTTLFFYVGVPHTMMATMLELINQVLRRAGQSALNSLSNLSTPAKQSVDFLAQIYTELIQTVPVPQLYQQQVVLLAANEDTVDLPALGTTPDLVVLQQVYLITNNGLTKTPLLYMPDSFTTLQQINCSQPTGFYFEGTNLKLLGTPTQATTLHITYVPSPERFYGADDTTTVSFPLGWERVLILGTLAYLQQFLGEANANGSFLQYMNAKFQLKAQALKHLDLRFKGYRN
jgi:hypothetical protein